MKYDTALRDYVRDKIREIGKIDLLIGIPTYNNEDTIADVLRTAIEGAAKHFPDLATTVMVSDGGSLDYTRERAQAVSTKNGVAKIVSIYRGLPGKGTSIRAILEAMLFANAKCCLLFDADLKSITPDWIKAIGSPIMDEGFDFVAPRYERHKYDGTITNNLAYLLTRALYGKRIRQPIGGDFGVSAKLADFFVKQDVWETDIAKYGVDIWMTTSAINGGFNICESYLGSKIHRPKDPSEDLGPMFRQVVGTLFALMSRYSKQWRKTKKSVPVKTFKFFEKTEPPSVEISIENLITDFKMGYHHFASLWREIINRETFSCITKLSKTEDEESFHFPNHLWARCVYDFAYTYNRWASDKHKVVTIMTPLYYAQTASFCLESSDMDNEETEALIEEKAEVFEKEKPYLVKKITLWEEV